MPQSQLNTLMEKIRSKYDVETIPLRIGEKILNILQLKDLGGLIAELVDTKTVGIMDLPFWAKVWDASLVLAYFMGKQPVVLGQRILEVGAGIGTVGLYTALCGHRITISDIDEDALLFARANAILNNMPRLEVRKLDWNDPDLPEPYDVIIGSEVVYDRESYPNLVQFLRRALAPNGIIFLAKNAELNTPKFFSELTKHFEFKQTTRTVHSGDETQKIALYAIRHKNGASSSPCPRGTAANNGNQGAKDAHMGK